MITSHDNPSVDALDISYSVDAKKLLDSVNLRAGRGQFLGLIGPNGAGKSTLLRALSGMLRSHEGEVSLEGVDASSLSSKEIARMLALVPQVAPDTHGFTSLEVVLMGRYPHMGRFQIEGRADERIAMEAMQLTENRRIR